MKFVRLIHYSAFFGIEGHVALDRNPGPGHNTLLMRLIPGDLLSACPHRQFHSLEFVRAFILIQICVPLTIGPLVHSSILSFLIAM